ncbi:MAG: hypothetical protein IJR16_04755, partial [Spirochaetales bacterium]|nr:hypothetical protein [Spirochaetales bacterium]
VAVPVFSLDNFSNNHPFQIIGFINKDLLLSVDIDNASLPFDIESVTVSKNESSSTVRGIRIGTYSMRANSLFTLNITHTKLVCSNPSVGTESPTSADYRLDVYSKNTVFKSCVNEATDVIQNTSIVIHAEDVDRMGQDPSYVYLVNGLSMYVSMTDSAEDLALLEPGNYTSTIVFELVAGE